MRIALCDDERREVDNLHDLIENYALKKDYDLSIECFTSPRALLEKDRYDLYFLDFLMDEMDGVELARGLNEKFGGAVTIVYLTNFEDAAVQIINGRVYADGFLKKPVDAALLHEKLDFFYKQSFRGRFLIRRGSDRETVYARDILYAEAQGKKTVLHLWNGAQTYNYLLRDFEEEFLKNAGFFRIHRSYSVNLQYIESFSAQSVRLKNGETLPLKSKEFRQAYQNYIFSIR